MAHVWVTLTVVAFFALCWALIIGCDKIIGPDDQSDLAISDAEVSTASDTTVVAGETTGVAR
jgi:hypothetical protein